MSPERSCLDNKRVAVTFTILEGYPAQVPFDPREPYPEYRLGALDSKNWVYGWVRETLYRLGLDRENFESRDWNPLGEILEPGMTVVIKPNTVCTSISRAKWPTRPSRWIASWATQCRQGHLHRTCHPPPPPGQLPGLCPLAFLAELSAHIPDPHEKTAIYYDWYSNRTRGFRKARGLL